MMSYLQTIILGALQGFTELFPISSLGHTVVLPSVLGWNIDQSNEFFIIFIVATHLATALVLFIFFWKDWMRIIAGFFRSLARARIPANDTYARLAWLVIAGTIPAGALGLVFQHKLREFFAAPTTVALFLIGNGALLYAAELLRRRAVSHPTERGIDAALSELSFKKAFGIGFMQSLALFPGFSRTGATLAGGLLAGLSHESAARFSFLLATPIILAASVLKLPELAHADKEAIGLVLIGTLVSGVAAYLSVRFLTRYFKTNTLTPFAIYCVFAGVIAFLMLS